MKIRHVALSETILQDKLGRWSLIGIYSDDILVDTFPAHVTCALYVEVEGVEDGEIELEFKLGKKTVAKGFGLLECSGSETPSSGVISALGIDLRLKESAEFSVILYQEGKRKTLLKKKIRLRRDRGSERIAKL